MPAQLALLVVVGLAGSLGAQDEQAEAPSAELAAPTSLAEDLFPQRSALWGAGGELWSEVGRLPDFSYAGYHCGEDPLPAPGDIPVVASVRDFGAVGDGVTDDTAAIQRALASAEAGALFVPAGHYLVTDVLRVERSGVVLRGAGSSETVFVCPRPLNDIEPNWGATTGGRRTSNDSWSGGILRVQGSFGSNDLADVTEPARRGDRTLAVSTSDGLQPGQRVEVFAEDDAEKSLATHLYTGEPGDLEQWPGARASLVVTLTAVEPGRVHFDRALRFDLRPSWKPRLRRFAPTVSEVGIESLGFEFPVQPYAGHFTELGHNAIALVNVADCWVRDVHVQNADSGVFVGASFCSLTGMSFASDREPERGRTGHHGVTLGGTDNLFTQFRFDTRYVHDLTLSANDAGNVFSRGSGLDLNLDHHRRAPYANLFTDLDIGRGTRLWASGGGNALGKHCAGRGTFWGLRAERSQRHPGEAFGPRSINIVGVTTERPSVTEPDGLWFEVLDPARLEPRDLHAAQLAWRLAARDATPPEIGD